MAQRKYVLIKEVLDFYYDWNKSDVGVNEILYRKALTNSDIYGGEK